MRSTHGHPQQGRAYRDRLKARGLRPVLLWVPDTRRPEFAEAVKQQLALVEADADDRETLAFIETATDWAGRPPPTAAPPIAPTKSRQA
ncbi:antitoxin MazE family protein [uncultured Thiodictyon sp.]|uniref:antitoxin MazE family protein n=1 Tax=uncultured Thiodictyon sp. TaxID=1846217 RepID=UPI0025E03801|nr:antitoxin MazE family protein [uncultured Thiodictyon sp.]